MGTNEALVSIVMPVFNCEDYITCAIQSIINQRYNNWELLICDDASTDASHDLILKYKEIDERIRVFFNLQNKKLLQTRNALLEYCKGDFITFQDADDYSHPDRLYLMVKEFTKRPGLGLLCTQVAYVNKRGKIFRTSRKPTNYQDVLKNIYHSNVVGGSIMMIKKSAFSDIGFMFRDYFDGLSYQDYDLSLLIAQKYECYSLPSVLYYYRQHENSTSKLIQIERLLAKEVVIHLAKQRRDRGSDDLMDGNPQLVDQYFENIKIPYYNDRSLIYRKYAADFMYNRLYKKAISTSWKAIKKRPTKWVNWMTLQYCIRKSILSLIKPWSLNLL